MLDQAPVHIPAIWRRLALGATLLMIATGVLLLVQSLAARRPVIAVAAFDNASGDAARDGDLDRMADAIADRLARLGADRIGVIDQAAELRRHGAERNLPAIARTTGAAFVVLGELHANGNRLTLQLQLIRLDDGAQLWVQRIERRWGQSLKWVNEEAADEVEAAVRQFVLHERAGRD